MVADQTADPRVKTGSQSTGRRRGYAQLMLPLPISHCGRMMSDCRLSGGRGLVGVAWWACHHLHSTATVL